MKVQGLNSSSKKTRNLIKKTFAELMNEKKELNKIREDSPVYNEAIRLKSFLSFFKEIPFSEVLENSILREFIGGSCFYKY